MPKSIGFGYMGGKLSHLPWILPLLPMTKCYCEPFGGSAAVLLNRVPSPIEIYNDLNGDVVNFFQVLRLNVVLLMMLLYNTPYSRGEFAAAVTEDKNSDLERARLFFVKLLQSRLCQATAKMTKGRWNHTTTRNGALTKRDCVREGRAQGVSRWVNKIGSLDKIADRLRLVQIENYPALKIIEIYDGPNTLFYLDPPYPFESRLKHNIYKYEMSNRDHEELAAAANSAIGLVAVSGYDCDLMNRLYPSPKWRKHFEKRKGTHYNVGNISTRQEVLWTNYDPHELRGQKSFEL